MPMNGGESLGRPALFWSLLLFCSPFALPVFFGALRWRDQHTPLAAAFGLLGTALLIESLLGGVIEKRHRRFGAAAGALVLAASVLSVAVRSNSSVRMALFMLVLPMVAASILAMVLVWERRYARNAWLVLAGVLVVVLVGPWFWFWTEDLHRAAFRVSLLLVPAAAGIYAVATATATRGHSSWRLWIPVAVGLGLLPFAATSAYRLFVRGRFSVAAIVMVVVFLSAVAWPCYLALQRREWTRAVNWWSIQGLVGGLVGLAGVWVLMVGRSDNGCTGVSNIYSDTMLATLACFAFGPSLMARALVWPESAVGAHSPDSPAAQRRSLGDVARFLDWVPRRGWVIVKTASIVLGVWFAVHTSFVLADGFADDMGSSDIAVVLGNKVNEDGTPSQRLRGRSNKGLKWANLTYFPFSAKPERAGEGV